MYTYLTNYKLISDLIISGLLPPLLIDIPFNIRFGACVYLVKGGNMNCVPLSGLKHDWVFNILPNKKPEVVSDSSKYLPALHVIT